MNLPEHLALASAKPASGSKGDCCAIAESKIGDGEDISKFWAAISLGLESDQKPDDVAGDISLDMPNPAVVISTPELSAEIHALDQGPVTADMFAISTGALVPIEIKPEELEPQTPSLVAEIAKTEGEPDGLNNEIPPATVPLITAARPAHDDQSQEHVARTQVVAAHLLDGLKKEDPASHTVKVQSQVSRQRADNADVTNNLALTLKPPLEMPAAKNFAGAPEKQADDSGRKLESATVAQMPVHPAHNSSLSNTQSNLTSMTDHAVKYADTNQAFGVHDPEPGEQTVSKLDGSFSFAAGDRIGPVNTGPIDARANQPIAPDLQKSNIRTVADAVASLKQDGSVEVALDPPELGRIHLTMKAHETQMSVVVAADRPEVLDMIRRHIDVLRSELLAQGFTAFDFDLRHGKKPGANQPEFGGASVEVDGAETSLDQTQNTIRVVAGRMDIRI